MYPPPLLPGHYISIWKRDVYSTDLNLIPKLRRPKRAPLNGSFDFDCFLRRGVLGGGNRRGNNKIELSEQRGEQKRKIKESQ